MKETVGYFGMGTMGMPMTRNLLKAGYKVVVWNRTREKAEAMAGHGAEPAATPAEVGERAQVVLACLADGAAVEATVTGPDGLLQAAGPGHVFIDMTTNSPPASARLAEALAAKGAQMLDAPVSGGDVGAVKGSLSIMVGGPPEVFQRCLPILEVLGARITLMGEQVGAGSYAKLANQIMVGTHLAAMGEALVFGAKAGLDLNKLTAALSAGMAASAVFELMAPKVLSGKFERGATADVLLKDLIYIGEAAGEMDISLPVTELVRSLFRQLVEQGHGSEDPSAIARIFEKSAGVEARA